MATRPFRSAQQLAVDLPQRGLSGPSWVSTSALLRRPLYDPESAPTSSETLLLLVDVCESGVRFVRGSSEPQSLAGSRNHARLSAKVASGNALPGRGVRAAAFERLGVGSGAPRLRDASLLCRLI
jgi:hypothetical protein